MGILDDLMASEPKMDKEGLKEQRTISYYKLLQQKNATFNVVFDLSEVDGSFSLLEASGIKIVMPNEKKNASEHDIHVYKGMVGQSIEVKINDIDETNNIVFVSRVYHVNPKIENINKEIARTLNKIKNSNERLVVWGRVLRVYDSVAIINIFDENVIGTVYIRDWSKGYTRQFDQRAKVGDIHHFEVIEQDTWKKNHGVRWRLSRASVHTNPWDEIPADMKEDAVISVRCVAVEYDLKRWWGVCDRIPEMEIFGNFSTKISKPMINNIYTCKIVTIDPAKHMFKVTPFKKALDGSVQISDAIESELSSNNDGEKLNLEIPMGED